MELKFEDFKNPMFNVSLVKRKLEDWVEDGQVLEEGQTYFDGVTFTDNFRQVGFTYWPEDRKLTIACLTADKKSVELFAGQIESMEEFEIAIKKADQKITRRKLKVITLKQANKGSS